jgi:FimV-like protein
MDEFICETAQEEAAMERSKQLCDEGLKLLDEGKYQEAMALFQQDLQLCEEVCGPRHSYVANSLIDLSDCHRGLGQFDQALALSQRALDIYQDSLGPEHRLTAKGLSAVGICYANLGQPDKAIPICERAADIRQNIYGAESQEVALSICSLAFLHFNLGQYDKALSLYSRALPIREKILGEEHVGTLHIIQRIADIYEILGQWDNALQWRQRLLALKEKVKGAEHAETLDCMNKLVWAYQRVHGSDQLGTLDQLTKLACKFEKLKEWSQALPLRQRAMEISEVVHGPEHADTVNCLASLEWVYEKLGHWDQVLTLRQLVLAIEEKTLGPEHADILFSITHLANTFEKLKQWDQALPLRQHLSSVNEKIYGSEHAKSLYSIDKLANTFEKLEQWGQALPLRERLLILRQKVHGSESRQAIGSISQLGKVYECLQRYEQALPLRQQLLAFQERGPYGRAAATAEISALVDLYEKLGQHEQAQSLRQPVHGNQDKPLQEKSISNILLAEASSKLDLAQAYGEMGDWEGALEIFQEILATREALLGPGHDDITKDLDNLVTAYEKLDRFDQALAMLTERVVAIVELCHAASRSTQNAPARSIKEFDSDTPAEEAAMKLSTYLRIKGRILRAHGRCQEAVAVFQIDRALCVEVCGAEHDYVANSYQDMALCYEGLGRYDQALQMYQIAILIHEKAWDAGHRHTTEDIKGIANCSGILGTSEVENLRMAYAQGYGVEYAKALDLVGWFAYVYENHDYQIDKAITLFQRELGILENKGSTDEERFLNYNLNLARLYKIREQWDRALPLLQIDLALCEKLYGVAHPLTLESVNRLAWLYTQLGQWNNALPLDLRALKGSEKNLGKDHFDTLNNLKCLAGTYERLGQWTKALPLRKRALKIAENYFGKQHAETACYIEELAGVYENLGQYEKVLPLLQSVIEIKGEENVNAEVNFKVATLLEKIGQAVQAQYIRIRTYPRALGSACAEAELFESFSRLEDALSCCMAIWRLCEVMPPPENAETLSALREFSAVFQRLSQAQDISSSPESAEMLRNILATSDQLLDALSDRAIEKANELIMRFARDVEGKDYSTGYWKEYEIYPLAHHAVLGYLQHLWAGGNQDEAFEQRSLKNDFNMQGINVAALCYIVARQRNIPFADVLQFLAPISPEADDSIPAIFQKIMEIAPAMNEEGISGEVKCLAGVVCGVFLDTKQARYNAAQIDGDFDVGFVVKYCNALESLKK